MLDVTHVCPLIRLSRGLEWFRNGETRRPLTPIRGRSKLDVQSDPRSFSMNGGGVRGPNVEPGQPCYVAPPVSFGRLIPRIPAVVKTPGNPLPRNDLPVHEGQRMAGGRTTAEEGGPHSPPASTPNNE